MKMWPVVAVAIMSSACVWACNGDVADDDGEGGQGGESTGGAASGGAGTGGAMGGLGGTLSCEPEDGSVSWGGAGGAGGAGSADIFGEWTDQYSSTYSFDESIIDTGYTTYDVVGFDNAGQYIVGQNSETDTYFPCLFSRFDWVVADGVTYLCRSVLGAPSVEEALAAPAADREDLATGCGSAFPWSTLTPQ
jgi:hypothetical protein